MSQQIYTKLHEALEAPPSSERDTLQLMTSFPHIVLDQQLYKTMDAPALSKSVGAMKAAGMMRLPYPNLMLELWGGWTDCRMFVFVSEEGTDGQFLVRVVDWWHGKIYPTKFEADFQWEQRPSDPTIEILGTDGKTIGQLEGPFEGFTVHYTHDQRKEILAQVGCALMLVIMMSNISGLERELVEPRKLNKQRERQGKSKIADHSVLRIGHVYNSAGRKVSVGQGTRSAVAVHMRAAHTRRQQHGQPWIDEHPYEAGLPTTTADHHLVLVDAVLVNFKDGTDLALPLPKVVRL